MTRDPFTNEQLRFQRAPTRSVPISGPFNAPPIRNAGDIAVAIVALVIAFFVATSELLGWPFP